MSEQTLQFTVASLLDGLMNEKKLWWNHPPNEEKRTRNRGALLKRSGMKAGAPDCMIILKGGKSLNIELKDSNSDGRLSKSQKEVHHQMHEMGIPVYTVKAGDVWDVICQVKKILIAHKVEV